MFGRLLCGFLLSSQLSVAAVYQLQYDGVVTDLGVGISSVAVGDTWSYRFLVDTSLQPFYEVTFDGTGEYADTLAGEQKIYAASSAQFSLSGFNYAPSQAHVGVSDALVYDTPSGLLELDVLHAGEKDANLSIDGQLITGIWVNSALSYNALASTSLEEYIVLAQSGVLPSLALAQADGLRLIEGVATSVSVSEVPVPAAIWFFLSGLSGLAVLKRRQA